jgi:hypothetical protein
MLQEDVSVGPSAERKPQALGVVGFLKRQVKEFFEDPFGYAIDRFFYCLLLGIGLSILAVGVRFVVSAVVSSVS